MIASLSQEQQWGWAYLHQEHCKGIDRQNAAIDEANSMLPEGIDPQPHVVKPTLEQYLTQRLAAIGDDGYRQILRIKEQTALAMFHALPPEQQAALIEQFQIPPVLEG